MGYPFLYESVSTNLESHDLFFFFFCVCVCVYVHVASLLQVMHELHPVAEAWAGIELIPYIAYGFRLYRKW